MEAMNGGLDIWVAYWSTLDFPGRFVARRQVACPGCIVLTDDVFTAGTFEELARLVPPGLAWLNRDPDDDAAIIGCWI